MPKLERHNTNKHTLVMHKKSELEAMTQEELVAIANELGLSAKIEDEQIDLIYKIIDEESIQSASQKTTKEKTPRKRVRISKKFIVKCSNNRTKLANYLRISYLCS